MKAFLASQNSHKAEEFAVALPGIQIVSSPVSIDVDENADSFLGNAQLKARAYADKLQSNALADDSGLCVDYLDGMPGVYSARFAALPPDVDDDPDRTAANNRKLLRLLKDVPEDKRSAHFCCALCLVIVEKEDILKRYTSGCADDHIQFYDKAGKVLSKSCHCDEISSIEICVLGKSYGHILYQLTGTGGFGYDPLFYSDEAHCTFAELTKEQKLTVSHRGHAIQLLRNILR